MIEIDGSQGEGGGQIIRSSLALSAVTGKPVRLTKIRAGRKKPGLMRQHLTAAQAAAKVCDAQLTDAEIGARSISFVPGPIRGGDFRFRVGTAGSTSLIAQTVLPALLLADEPSTLTLQGGTHNPWSPPYDFLERSFLPLLSRIRPTVHASLESHGFYPAGGGQIQLEIQPCESWSGIQLLEPIDNWEPRVVALVSEIPLSVGERECNTIRRKSNWPPKHFLVKNVSNAGGAGNVVMIDLASEQTTNVFTGFGKIGVKAEQIARDVLKEARAHLATRAPVGEYLADQLMMPMGLAASQGQSSAFLTGPLSKHSQTHLDVLKTFLPIHVSVETQVNDNCIVRFAPE